jgi:hypothetical protein
MTISTEGADSSTVTSRVFCCSNTLKLFCALTVILFIACSGFAIFPRAPSPVTKPVEHKSKPTRFHYRQNHDIVSYCTENITASKKSAKEGNSDDQWRYGLCLRYGEGVAQNLGKAAKYLERSALQGNSQGQVEYGRCLMPGKCHSSSRSQAMSFFQLSASQANSDG